MGNRQQVYKSWSADTGRHTGPSVPNRGWLRFGADSPGWQAGGFGREAVPLLRQNDYGGAISLMVSRVADVIAQDAGIQLTGSRPPPTATSPQEPGKGMSTGGVVLLILVVVVLLATRF